MKKRVALPLGILIVGAFLMVVGIANNEMTTVFKKAANICMECIGIG